MVVAAFVAPYLLEATARFALSAARVPGVRLGLITTEAADERAGGSPGGVGGPLAGR